MKVHKDLRCLGAFLVFPGRNWKHLHVSCQFSDRSFLLHCPPCKLCSRDMRQERPHKNSTLGSKTVVFCRGCCQSGTEQMFFDSRD